MGKANQLSSFKKEITKYREMGLGYKSIYLLLKDKLHFPMTYHGFRSWIINNIESSVSHAK